MASLLRQQISRVFTRRHAFHCDPQDLGDIDVSLLPRNVAVTFAARCARRVLPLFSTAWPSASPRVLEGIAHTVDVLEAPEDYVIDDDIARQNMMFLEQVATSATHAPTANRTARSIQAGYSATHMSVVHQMAGAVHELTSQTVRLSEEAIRYCNCPSLRRESLIAESCDDFRRLVSFAIDHRLTDDDPCSVKMMRENRVLT